MGLTDFIPGALDDAIVGAASRTGAAINEALGNTLQRKGPLRGAYLEYEVPIPRTEGGVQEAIEGALPGTQYKMRLLMKEPIGYWFDLDPKYPEYGKFGGDGLNKGRLYTKRAGFRFASFQVLLRPETEMLVPTAKAAKQRSSGGDGRTQSERISTFFIGVSDNVTVREFIEFLKASKRESVIIGIISPKKRKYQWGGVLHGVAGGGNLIQGLQNAIE